MTDSGRRIFESPDDAPRPTCWSLNTSASRNQAATLIANGHVLVGGRRERASYRAAAEKIDVDVPAPAGRPVVGESIPLAVSWDDYVFRRQAGGDGRPSSAGIWSKFCQRPEGPGHAIVRRVRYEPRGIVHRLTRRRPTAPRGQSDRAHSAAALRRVRLSAGMRR